MNHKSFLKNYSFSLILLTSIALGAGLGLIFKEKAAVLKPLGDIFLNLLFTAVVPLVFFSISSAIAEMSDLHRLGKIMGWMMTLFVATGLVSASLMILGVKLYPPALADHPVFQGGAAITQMKTVEQLVAAFTVPDFVHLLSKQNMLALIVFSLLVGLSASLAREDGKPFVSVLVSGNKVMMKAIHLIMYYAPVGLGAYFAYLTGVFGPSLLGSYLRVVTLYYPLSILYFFLGFSFYALLAGGRNGVKAFWTKSWSLKPCGCSLWGCSFMRSTILTTRSFRLGKCSRRMDTAASVSSVGTSPQQAMTASGAASWSLLAHCQMPMPSVQCLTAASMVNHCGAGCLPAITTLT